MRVTMFVTTNVTSDPRVMKEATAITEAGYQVHVIGICRTAQEPNHEQVDGVEIERVDLWHMRFTRWLKARRGRQSTDAMFDQKDVSAATQSYWRQYLIHWVHQLQFVLHVLVVWLSFTLAGLRHPAQVYHAHDFDTLLPAMLLRLWYKAYLIYDSHEYWYNERRHEFFSNFLIRVIERAIIPYCTQVFAVNHSIAERMAQHYGVSTPIVLMNVPSDTPMSRPLPLTTDQPIQLLYHGGYLAERGLEQLITAITLVNSPVHLTLRGYGDIEMALRRQVDMLGLNERVTFASPVSMRKLTEAASICHIGIIPYSKKVAEYALPNKIFEYMAAGLGLLANDLVEFRKIIIGHQIGMVCNTENPLAIASTIDEMGKDRDLLNHYRYRAWEAYQKYYTWQQHQQVLLEVYRDLQQSSRTCAYE